MNNAAEDFFNSLPSEKETEPEFNFMGDEPEKDKTPEKEPVTETTEESDGEKVPERKKPLRSERRQEKQNDYLANQLREEREARIRLEEQIKALAEARPKDVDPDLKKLLEGGISTEEAASIFESALSRAEERAAERAYERYLASKSQEDEEVNELHEKIETEIESIEDKYGVDLSKDKDTRNAFLDYVEQASDPESDALPNMQFLWTQFQATRKAPTTQSPRKEQVSSRSMVRSGSSRPDGKAIAPVTFDQLNKGGFWESLIGKKD